MKVIVCIKQVPDTKGGVQFNPDGTLNRGAMLTIMNPVLLSNSSNVRGRLSKAAGKRKP